jgi:hypothetical protein
VLLLGCGMVPHGQECAHTYPVLACIAVRQIAWSLPGGPQHAMGRFCGSMSHQVGVGICCVSIHIVGPPPP